MRTDLTTGTVKYIALLALVKIVPSHPHLVASYQETILAIVDDADISIRMRALELVSEMVSYDAMRRLALISQFTSSFRSHQLTFSL